MEVYMDFYFDDIFKNLERDTLCERYKRRELVQYFNTVITGCAKGENIDCLSACRLLIRSVLRFHESCRADNGQVCLMGKYHNVLYVAMKLAFDWSLQDNGIVARLLDDIYLCEKTFERIFLGAIFGTSAPHFLAGWKSDFLNKEENVHALVFFLDHATNANLEYEEDSIRYRFIDVPLESCGRAPPVRVVIQLGSSEMLMILLRFGARITMDHSSTNAVETILDRLKEYSRKYPYELVTCLKLILRVVPTIILSIDSDILRNQDYAEGYNYQRKAVLEKYGDILEDHLIPSSRCGLRPTELKHLCRCAIRDRLWENYQLPFGIRKLPVPDSLHRYLDICENIDCLSACRLLIRSVLRFHESCRADNGQVCLMGKYHNVLYVAMKLAFDWSLQDNGIVARLLDDIYLCEKTFERIFLGAIFGTSAPHFLAGWKSDFLNKEENVHALVFFLDHATNANLEYEEDSIRYRFIDVPLESCGRAPPVRVVIQLGSSEMLMILLRFGARITMDHSSTNAVETILDRLKEYSRKYPYELVTCLKLILRVVPTIILSIDSDILRNQDYAEGYNYQRKAVLEKYGDILEDHLIPSSRCGLRPTELKHLCRCAIRDRLWENYQLPFGIRKLPVPDSLHRYLDICED